MQSSPKSESALERVRIGFIPLTDCASLVIAAERGFDRRHGVRIELVRQPSWSAVRDRLLAGELDMAHMLYGQVYGLQLGLGSVQSEMAVLMGLNQNGQAITLSRRLAEQGVHDGASLAAHIAKGGRRFVFAQTFPTGTHAMWLYYWLAAAGVDPFGDASVVTVPPPRMGAHLGAGSIDGFCAGEPWNGLALLDGQGVTVATSQSIWPDHPEKALACTAAFSRARPETCRAVVRAVLEAARWIDENDAHRTLAAETIAGSAYVGVGVDALLPRMLGRYEDGLGRAWQDESPLRFHGNGAVNFPWLSDGLWFMTQFRRWGLLPRHPDYQAVAASVQRIDLFREAAASVGVPLPATSMRSSRLLDGRLWDGLDPAAFADAFPLAARPLASA